MMRNLVACVALLAPTTLAQDIERGWSLVREDLEVFLDPEAGSMRLEGSLVARLDRTEETRELALGLNARARLMRFEEVHADNAEVVLNETVPGMGQALGTRVRFASPKHRGDEVEISFVCSGDTRGRQLVVDPSIAFASWVEAWYPILPPPKGTSMGGATKVAGRTTFHLPVGWRAVTNGGLVTSTSTESETIEVWESEHALSRSFAAGPYTVLQEKVGELDVSLYLLNEDLPNPGHHVESLAAAIQAMEARLGPYPYPSYAIAEIPVEHGHFGASSEQGFIMVKPFFLDTAEGNLPLFAHEAGHGWWGNTVGTAGPGGLLCSESLAQYGAVISAEALWGKEGATEFLRWSRPGYVSNQCGRGFFELWRGGEDKPMSQLVSGGSGMDHTLSDAKGHWVYHMLRRRVGDEVFFGTLRGLIAEYTNRTMTLEDLRTAFQGAAPDAGLERFFAQWLDQAGAPVLWSGWNEGAGALEIEQLQGGEPYELHLDVELITASGTSTRRVHLTDAAQLFPFEDLDGVAGVRLDPEHELLIWDPEYGPAPVPGLEDRVVEPSGGEDFPAYLGEYLVDELGAEVVLASSAGYLTLSMNGAPAERLIHTGEHRFRTGDGFVVFELEGEKAQALTFHRDRGGTRRALRREGA